jgi:hypothetical protein
MRFFQLILQTLMICLLAQRKERNVTMNLNKIIMKMLHKILIILEIPLFMGKMGIILGILLAAPLKNILHNRKKTFLSKEICSMPEKSE